MGTTSKISTLPIAQSSAVAPLAAFLALIAVAGLGAWSLHTGSASQQRAMGEIMADPEVVVRYQLDEVLMGVLYSLAAPGPAGSGAQAAADAEGVAEDCD